MSSQIHESAYFEALYGVRLAAAYLVWIHHFMPVNVSQDLFALAQECHVGVTLFFRTQWILNCPKA